MNDSNSENFAIAKVPYTFELDGKLIIVENVPARVSVQTGEQFFAPETVEQIHRILNGSRTPRRTVWASVFEFAA
jgi:YgiT-type zinc finger domain-containing protein